MKKCSFLAVNISGGRLNIQAEYNVPKHVGTLVWASGGMPLRYTL